MKQLDIAELQHKRGNYRYLVHHAKTDENLTKFRNVRNELKSKIRETKATVHKKILSSKNSKEILKVIQRISKRKKSTLKLTHMNLIFQRNCKKVTSQPYAKQRIRTFYQFI